MERTFCGQVNANKLNKTVLVKGWIKRKRKLGNLIFLDLIDRTGIVQIVVQEKNPFFETVKSLTRESVVEITGYVVARSNPNSELPTGNWEIELTELTVDSVAQVPPMLIDNDTDALEETRMKYRYLDLRRPNVRNIFWMRSNILYQIREFLHQKAFIEVETPVLGKPTPEGARDYLVPSRLNNGLFYALPQSPQIYKQLLMVAGFDRYFQVAKCFRDEDLRSDRQPEFTQVDLEMSFTNELEIQTLVEEMLKKVFWEILNIDVKTPFLRMTYADAMNKYGSDKPDLRFQNLITDVTPLFQETTFAPFQNVEKVKVVQTENFFSKKQHQVFLKIARDFGAAGLGWISFQNGNIDGSLKNVLSNSEMVNLQKQFGDGTIFFAAGNNAFVNPVLGAVRSEIGKTLDLKGQFQFLWVVDWPLFEWNDDRWVAAHHPFTQPQNPDTFDKDPQNAFARAYDIVLNGVEIGGGSIRITDSELQNRMFQTIGLTKEQTEEKFGFLMNAFRFGVPPHGGLAIGIDRLIQLMFNLESIKECIAFPKNNQGIDPMLDAPTTVEVDALQSLGITIKK